MKKLQKKKDILYKERVLSV